ncbi:MAG: hypothetical protein IJQ54_02865 [Kiritimatiellae bacterium]|nr:hypothetical protein [Kiritimatiellia bacterium]
MASSLTSPGLILASNKAIMEAQRGIAFASQFSTDFSAELQGEGKTITVPVFSGNATVYNEDDNDYETTDGSIIPVQVTLDTLVKVTFKLKQGDLLEVNKSATSRNCGIAGGRAIGRKIEELIMGKLDYSHAKAQATSFQVTKLGKAVATAEKNELDPATLVAILNPDAYGDLLDANVNNAAIQGSDIASALGAKYGIKAILCSAKVSTYSAQAVQKSVGFLVADSAIAIAGRGIEQAVDGLYNEYGVETDEKSGLPVTSFVHGTPGKNARFMNTACLLGAKRTAESDNKAPGYIQLVTA